MIEPSIWLYALSLLLWVVGAAARHYYERARKAELLLARATAALHYRGLYLVQVGNLQMWCEVSKFPNNETLPPGLPRATEHRPMPHIPQPGD